MSDLGNKQIMARNIRRYMEEKGINQTELCNALGFKFMTVSDWVNAKSYPRIDKIEMMANYFGISKADLVEAPEVMDGIRDEQDLLAEYLKDDSLRRLVLFAGGRMPKECREKFVDAVINAIDAMSSVR